MTDDGTLPHASIYTIPGANQPPGDTTRPAGEVLPLPGGTPTHIGGYRLLGLLGRGGMGAVYRAESVALRRVVALKVLTAPGSPRLVERFMLEARSAARVKHPNVVVVHEVGQDGPMWFLAMDLVEGESLRAAIQRGGPLELRSAARIVETIARALHHAHGLGVLHRDVKPHNILIARDGTPLLADFGIAKEVEGAGVTATGEIVGTPSYMPPEQADSANRARVDRRTDVYALGATLYEALTGAPPFTGATALDVIRKVFQELPEPPRALRSEVDRDLETITLRALEKEPAARYDTAAELADDLERWVLGEPIAARRPGVGGRVAKWAARRPGAAGSLAAAGLAGLIATTAELVERRVQGRVVDDARREAIAAAASAAAGKPGRVGGLVASEASLAAAGRWLGLAPADAEARSATAAAAVLAGDAARRAAAYQSAVVAFQLAARLRPGDEQLGRAVAGAEALTRGLQRSTVSDLLEALPDFEAASRARPDWVEPWVHIAQLHAASARFAAAVKALDAAVALEPGRADLYVKRGALRRLMGGDPAASWADYDRAMALKPEEATLWVARAELRNDRDDMVGAIADMSEAIRRAPGLAQLLVVRGRYRESVDDPAAIEDFEEATRRAPDLAPGWFALGQAHLARERPEEALAAFDRAAALAPDDAEILTTRATTRSARGDDRGALADVEAALVRSPDDASLHLLRAQLVVGRDPQGAVHILSRVVRGTGGSAAEALARRAEAYEQLGRHEEAIADATAALLLDPSQEEAQELLERLKR